MAPTWSNLGASCPHLTPGWPILAPSWRRLSRKSRPNLARNLEKVPKAVPRPPKPRFLSHLDLLFFNIWSILHWFEIPLSKHATTQGFIYAVTVQQIRHYKTVCARLHRLELSLTFSNRIVTRESQTRNHVHFRGCAVKTK